VAQSSCEVEYIAAATAACQGVWLRRLLGDLMNEEEELVVLNIDNKSTISLCKNPVHHDRSKHIDTKYHYIRECVEESKIEVNYVCINDQLADILTKSLSRLKFLEMRERIGVQAVKTSTSCLWRVIVSDDNHYDVGTMSCARMCRLFRVVNRLCTRIDIVLGVDSYTVLGAGFIPSRSSPSRV
jgi:hypothetical protein